MLCRFLSARCSLTAYRKNTREINDKQGRAFALWMAAEKADKKEVDSLLGVHLFSFQRMNPNSTPACVFRAKDLPPCSVMIFFAMARPRPVPLSDREVSAR